VSRYLARRLAVSVAVVLGVLVLTFSMLRFAPGDPVIAMFGRQVATPERLDELRSRLGLDDPLPLQFLDYVSDVATGDLGVSIQTRRPVADAIIEQLPGTIELMVAAMVVSIVIGIPVGVLTAVREGTASDSITTVVGIGLVSIPSFWLGLLLILLFSVGLGWLPATSTAGDVGGLVLPALTLGLPGGALLARLIRSSMLEVLAAPHLTAARARGLGPARVTYYAFRNAVVPVVTIIGLQVGYLLAGSVIVETIFARQGIGRLAVDSIARQDFPTAQGVVMVGAVGYVVVNTLTDLLHRWLDPRVRL
jgi:ABC-type dipeptide/oligopeptide/nickel transport system permease component